MLEVTLGEWKRFEDFFGTYLQVEFQLERLMVWMEGLHFVV